MLFLDDKVVQVFLLGEFIAEAQSVVEQAEADDDAALVCRLVQRDGQFVVVVADLAFLAPDGFPSLVESGGLCVFDDETRHQVGLGINEALVLVAHLGPFEVRLFVGVFFFQFQSQCTGLDDGFVLIEQVIGRCALPVQAEVHHQVSVR